MASQILIKGTFSSIIYWDHKLYFVAAVWADFFQWSATTCGKICHFWALFWKCLHNHSLREDYEELKCSNRYFRYKQYFRAHFWIYWPEINHPLKKSYHCHTALSAVISGKVTSPSSTSSLARFKNISSNRSRNREELFELQKLIRTVPTSPSPHKEDFQSKSLHFKCRF